MKQWICVKCEETASSKCPGQRSVFPNDQIATVVSNYIGVDLEIVRDDKERPFVEIDLVIRHGFLKEHGKETTEFMDKGAVGVFFERLEELKKIYNVEEILRRALCDHRWVLVEGTTCKLGCTHTNLEQWKEKEMKLAHDAGRSFKTKCSICDKEVVVEPGDTINCKSC